MGVLEQLGTMLTGLVWRVTGRRALGRRLVGRADSDDDDVRELALMALVSGGERGVDCVTEAYSRGSTSTSLPQVLVSIGTPAARAELSELTSHRNHEVRRAAERALADVSAIDRYDDGDQTG